MGIILKHSIEDLVRLITVIILFSVAATAAFGATLNVVPSDFGSTSGADIEWSAEASTDGDHSIYLQTFSSVGDGDEARIIIQADDVDIQTLANLTSFSWDALEVTGYMPHLDIYLGNGDILIFEFAKADNANCDTTPYPTGNFSTFNGTTINDSTYAWSSSGLSGPCGNETFDANHKTLEDWKTVYSEVNVTKFEIEIENNNSQSTAYVDNIRINGETYYGLIADALSVVSDGDTINVASGTYNEDLSISTHNIKLSGEDKDTTTIKGITTIPVSNWTSGSWTYTSPNVDINANGVEMHGFTIESPSIANGSHANGLVITGQNIKIYDNMFVFDGNIEDESRAVGIQTYRVDEFPTNSIAGLLVENNTFSGNIGSEGYYGILINRDFFDASDININGNTFTGRMTAGIHTERNHTYINNNSFDGDGFSDEDTNGIWIWDWNESRDINNIQITDNTLKNLGSDGIKVGYNETQNITQVILLDNSFENNRIHVKDTLENLNIDDILSDNSFDQRVLVRENPVAVNTIFNNIQAAIDAAYSGHIIDISAGNFTENLSINKTLTIKGNGSGATTLNGEHTITADNVTIQDLTLSLSEAGTAITIDSSSSAINNTEITDSIFTLTQSNSTGIYIQGSANAVNHIGIESNAFNGASDKSCDAVKIGGVSGSPIGINIAELDFLSNTVDRCSTLINLHDKVISDILIDNNTYTNTEGVIHIWGEGTPTGNLDGFIFTNNTIGSTNSYGIGIDSDGAAVFNDSNFGSSNMVRNNKFIEISGTGGFKSVSILSPLDSYILDATDNWWGDTEPGDSVDGNVDYSPFCTSSDCSDTLEEGQADVNSTIVLTDDTVLDLLSETNNVSAGTVVLAGVSKNIGNFTSGNLSNVNLSSEISVGNGSVLVKKAVKLESDVDNKPINITNSNLTGITISIPDGAVVLGPASWNSTLVPPRNGPDNGTAPSGYSIGTIVIEVGSAASILLFDTPVTVFIENLTGTIGYKPAGSSVWEKITACNGTYSSPENPDFSGECYISDSTDTKIITYHFTTFAKLNVNPSSGSSGSSSDSSSGGGGSSGFSYSPSATKEDLSVNESAEQSANETPENDPTDTLEENDPENGLGDITGNVISVISTPTGGTLLILMTMSLGYGLYLIYLRVNKEK